ncbi:MAG: translocation/assembly module TamB domain-containing protein [Candidatus Cloacimonetes bacterium]|nr:translocation/assembly module TamB domain-containing protein [Candidatus Cloacimonadota bacterium]
MSGFEKVKRWLIYAGITILFILWGSTTIINSYVTDMLNYHLKTKEFKGYVIQSSQVSGDLFSGFIVSNIHLRRKGKKEEIARVGTLFVKVNPWKLFEKHLEIELAKITNIEVAVENAEEFFQNLVGILGGKTRDAISQEKVFDRVSCSRMFFYNLNLKRPLGLLFARDKKLLDQTGMKVNPSIRFKGEVQWLTEEIRLVASANDFTNNSKDSSLPIKLELLFNFLSSEGQIAFLSDKTPINKLFSMKGLELDGEISANSKLTFSKDQTKLGVDASLIKILGDEDLYFKIEGTGDAHIAKLAYKKFQLQNLNFDSIWNQHRIEIQNGKTRYLGGLISFNYLYDEKEAHTMNAFVYQLQMRDMFHSFGESEIAKKVRGFIDFSITMENGKLNVSPIELTNGYYEKYPIYVEKIHVDPGENPLDLSSFLWKFQSKGGSFVGGFIDSFNGSLSKDQFKMAMSVEEFSIDDLDFIKKYYSQKSIEGYLDLKADLSIDLKNGDYSLNGKGIVKDAQIEYKRLDEVSLQVSSNQYTTNLTGRILFEDAKGALEYHGISNESEEYLKFDLKNFDLTYLERDLLSGVLDGSLYLSREPNLKASFELKAKEDVYIADVKLANPEFWYDSNGDRFQFKLKADGLKGIIKGKHDVLQLIQELDPNKYIETLASIHIDVYDDSLSRYKDLKLLSYNNFENGKVRVSGNYNQKVLNLNVNELNINIPNNRIFLSENSKLKWNFGKELNWDLKFSRESTLNQITRDFMFLSAKDDNIHCKFYELQVSLLKDVIKNFDVPVRGSLDFDVYVKNLFGEIQAKLDLNNASLHVKIPQGETYFKKASGSIRLNEEFMNIDKFLLQKKDAEFYVKGRFPLMLVKNFPFVDWSEDKSVDLDMNLPSLPVEAFKDLLPDFIKDIKGSFEGKLKLTDYLPFPSMNGYTTLKLDELAVEDKGKTFVLKDLNLDIDYQNEKLIFKKIDGKYDDLKIDFNGELTPQEDYRFVLKGSVAKDYFEWDYITVKNASIPNVFVAGAKGRLSGFAALNYESGGVHYEKLMASLETPTNYFQVPFYDKYEFGLRITPTGDASLKGDFFTIDILPKLTVQFYNDKVVLEGKIESKDGYINLTRNQFRVSKGSHITFVPFDEPEKDANEFSFIQKDKSLWGSDQFQVSSISSKLGQMWDIDQREEATIGTNGISVDRSSNFFDSFLRLSAIAEIGDDKVELNLNGHIDNLNYDLRTNDPTLSKDDIFKMLVSHGVGMSTRPNLTTKNEINLNRGNQVTGASDEMILSSQISAQLEDKIFGRHFENIASSVFGLKNIQIEPNLIKSSSGIGRFRVGTKLSDELFLSHQQENYLGEMRNETRLKLKVSEEVGLIFKRQLREKQSFDFSGKDNEKEIQFGFERRFKF